MTCNNFAQWLMLKDPVSRASPGHIRSEDRERSAEEHLTCSSYYSNHRLLTYISKPCLLSCTLFLMLHSLNVSLHAYDLACCPLHVKFAES